MKDIRTPDEIQRAHDMLTSVIMGDLKIDLPEAMTASLVSAVNVLCWVLHHDHNEKFAALIDLIDGHAALLGMVFGKMEDVQ